ncbi:hypothetical protein PHA51_07845 [Rodentibacter pneumotropicus]|uniref:toxin VasX n=1 Tax=Rodentibacter pneumotropicus TaxID=758 RepID=UPI00232EDB01|nr:toxin VasX [Rodentibacter pneumotropicus]MDC2825939.1 hypothetical protein [Rodentibacter pneumotropicus]
MENSKKESSTPRKDLGLLKEEAKKLSITNNKCELPLIPIYPVRYALSGYYLDSAQASLKNNGLETTSNIADILRPDSMRRGRIHQLQQLRQGYVYIYSPTTHQAVATDKNNKWLVFRYVTHSDDINSRSVIMEEDKNSKTANFKFILYQWGDKGANGEWKQMEVQGLPLATDTVFVDKTQQWVYIAYSEYPWSAEMFERLEADEKIRQSMMAKVNVDSKEKTKNSAPFEMLYDLVVEFTNDQTLIDIGKNAFTGIQKAFKTPTLCGEQEKGLVVALEDTIGEMRELQDILYKLVDAKTTYYEEYSYPLTIGHLIDPKVVYDVQGKKFPLENNQRIIEQPGVKKVLSKDFDQYTKLVADSYHRFDVPRKAIIEQLSQLKRREPLRVLLTELMPSLLKKLNPATENTAGLDRTSYVFCRTVADICMGLESSPEGEKELETLFTAPEASNGSISGDTYRKSMKEAFDAIFGATESIKDFSHRINNLKRFFSSMDSVLTFVGNTLIKIWLREGKCVIDRSKILSTYGFLTMHGNPEAMFMGLQKSLLTRLETQARADNITRKTRQKALSQIQAKVREEKRAWLADFEAYEQQAEKLQNSKRFIGVLATFNGIRSLGSYDPTNKDISKTKLGKMAQNELLQRTSSILDIAIGTSDVAYGLGLIQNPGATVPFSKAAKLPGGTLRALGTNVRAYAYLGGGIVVGILAAFIALGDLAEAIDSGDTASIIGSSLVLTGSIIGVTASALGSFAAFSGMLALGIAGAIALVLILVGSVIFTYWGKSKLALWVERVFWGNGKKYYYWNNIDRKLNTQFQLSKLLANKEIIKRATPLLEYKIDGISFDNSYNESSNDVIDYITVKNGFDEELYDYFIQHGLQITHSNDIITITYAKFTKSIPTPANLKIYCREFPGKGKNVVDFYHQGMNVRFSLSENGITSDSFTVHVTFTDNEGDSINKLYQSDGFKKYLNQQYEKAIKIAEELGE